MTTYIDFYVVDSFIYVINAVIAQQWCHFQLTACSNCHFFSTLAKYSDILVEIFHIPPALIIIACTEDTMSAFCRAVYYYKARTLWLLVGEMCDNVIST